MKRLLILVLTNIFILTLILFGKPVKAENTAFTGQFFYGLDLYVLPNAPVNNETPNYNDATYHKVIGNDDFISTGLFLNFLEPVIPVSQTGYIYIVWDDNRTWEHHTLGGATYGNEIDILNIWTPFVEAKTTISNLAYRLLLDSPKKIDLDTGTLSFIYYSIAPENQPSVKLIDCTTNNNDFIRVQQQIDGYNVGYNNGYNTGYQEGQTNGYYEGTINGQTNGYNFGYQEGQTDGYQKGYKAGYDEGISIETSTGLNRIVDFNQLIQNGNFASNTIWQGRDGATISISDNTLAFTSSNTDSFVRTNYNITGYQNHKYLIIFDGKSTTNTQQVNVGSFGGYLSSYLIDINSNWARYSYIGTLTQNFNATAFIYNKSSNLETIYIRNYQIIDLTQIYGAGNEPSNYTLFRNDFPSSYYNYTTSTTLSIEFEKGKIEGKLLGYDEGLSYQATQQLTSDGWIKNIFSGIGSFLALEILPGVSIGLIVGIPFVISVAWFVVRSFRGGGD